jgi:hypothetical protein
MGIGAGVLRGVGAVLLTACLAVGTGCQLFGGGELRPDHCEIKVSGIETWNLRGSDLDVAYQVRGKAGAPAVVWLAAKTARGDYISGYGVDVGPGAFAAVVDLKLTGMPSEFLALLEVAGKRCKAKASKPKS